MMCYTLSTNEPTTEYLSQSLDILCALYNSTYTISSTAEITINNDEEYWLFSKLVIQDFLKREVYDLTDSHVSRIDKEWMKFYFAGWGKSKGKVPKWVKFVYREMVLYFEGRKSNQIDLENPSDYDLLMMIPAVLRKFNDSLKFRDYLASTYVTVTDFLCFGIFHKYLDNHMGDISLWPDYMFSEIGHFLIWYNTMQNNNYMQEMIENGSIKINYKDFGDKLLTKQEVNQYVIDKLPKFMFTDVSNRNEISGKAGIIIGKIEDGNILINYSEFVENPLLDWDEMPVMVNPIEGHLKPGRALRKRQQLENICYVANEILEDGQIVVDFCSGGGHLSVLLAYLYPKCHFILVDTNDISLCYAVDRSEALGLNNIEIYCGDIHAFSKPFDVAVAVHSCGFLTDIVQDKAFENNAAYLIVPCCFGKMATHKGRSLNYPRSQAFKEVLTHEEYFRLTRLADLDSSTRDFTSEEYLLGKKCMGLVDTDRNLFAQEKNYQTLHYTMLPETCSPKNEIISGKPKINESE